MLVTFGVWRRNAPSMEEIRRRQVECEEERLRGGKAGMSLKRRLE
jgi:hypothetical protein